MAYRGYPIQGTNTTTTTYDPSTFISSCQPWQYGIANRFDFNATDPTYCQPPGVYTPIDCSNYVQVFQGYFHAITAGSYVFSTADAEDYLWLWNKYALGTSWNDRNQEMLAIYQQSANTTLTFTADSYNAITVMWSSQKNYPGTALISLRVTLPGASTSVYPAQYMSPPTASEFDCPYPIPNTHSVQNYDGYYNGLAFRGYAVALPNGPNPYYWNGNCNPTQTGVAYDLDYSLSASQETACGPPGASIAENCTTYAAVYQGYFYAVATGTYNFSTTLPEDYFWFWIGTNAGGTAWTNQNFNIQAKYQIAQYATVALTKGTYTKITIMWFNRGSGYPGINIDFRVAIPGGTAVNPRAYYYRPTASRGEFDCQY